MTGRAKDYQQQKEVKYKYMNNDNIRTEAAFNAWKDRAKNRAIAFTAVIGESGAQLGVAEFNIGGYSPVNVFYKTYKEAQKIADKLNTKLGLSSHQADEIVASSMRRAVSK